ARVRNTANFTALAAASHRFARPSIDEFDRDVVVALVHRDRGPHDVRDIVRPRERSPAPSIVARLGAELVGRDDGEATALQALDELAGEQLAIRLDHLAFDGE